MNTYVKINGSILEKMYDFTGKKDNYLEYIKVSFFDGKMEMTATNGQILARFCRSLECDENAEGLTDIYIPVRRFFKKSELKKSLFGISQKDGDFYLVDLFKCATYKLEKDVNFPNYKLVIRNEHYFPAEKYAYFNPKNLQLMADIMENDAAKVPYVSVASGVCGHSWLKKEYSGAEFEVVIMPIRSK